MHIGFDGKRFFQNVTGLGNYARSTVLGLAENFPQHRYTLYAPRLGGPFCTMPLPNALHVQEACPVGRAFPALWRSLAIPVAASRDRVDIYHGLSHELPLTNFPPQVRTVVTMHDLLFLTHPHLYPWADRKLYAWKYQRSCLRADLVVAISTRTADDVQEFFGVSPDRIRVAYQSCDPAFSATMDASSLDGLRCRLDLPRDFVLFVGSLIERKGVHTLIEAVSHLPQGDHPYLVIAGTGPLEAALREQARSAGLESRTRFLGRVADADLPGLYRLARVFAYPSVGEGFGIPILEALASGTPVVTSTGSCFAEAGGDAALYAAPTDAGELAAALAHTLGDEELRRDMIERGLRHAENFRIERTSARLMDIYAELAARGKAR
ncbi:glycosyltransferase family 4 protein [Desulfomicrobium salsuginis]